MEFIVFPEHMVEVKNDQFYLQNFVYNFLNCMLSHFIPNEYICIYMEITKNKNICIVFVLVHRSVFLGNFSGFFEA